MNERIIHTEDGYAVDTILLKSFSRNLAEDQIFNYFSSFGKITRVTHINAVDSLGFVKFDRPEAAATAFKMKHHMIAGHHVGVEITQNWSQYQPTINDDLPKESTTSTEFMDLNDDCIREILSRLNVIDLCSLRELSESKTSRNSRLSAIINDVFARKYKICDLNAVSSLHMQRFLANFGPLILKLSMIWIKFFHKEMNSSVRLGSLDRSPIDSCFQRVRLSPHYQKVVLSNLKKLHVENCRFQGDLLAHCSTLLELTVHEYRFPGITTSESILQYTFPALETFRFHCQDFDEENMKNFVSRHRKLKTIKLTSADDDHTLLIPTIVDSCSELKRLHISIDGRNDLNAYEIAVKSIASLRYLEHLTINYDSNPLMLIRQLRYVDSLRELHLSSIKGSPEIISALSQLKMLECLEIFIFGNRRDFNPLAELYRLKELSIMSPLELSYENFELGNAISHLPDLEVLFILKTNYKIDKELHSKIVNARAKAGSDRHSLVIRYNRVEHKFSSK